MTAHSTDFCWSRSALLLVTTTIVSCHHHESPAVAPEPVAVSQRAPGTAERVAGHPVFGRVTAEPATGPVVQSLPPVPADPAPEAALPRPLAVPYSDLRRHTTRSIGEDVGIDISPDGKSLVFSSTRESETPRIYLKEHDNPLVRSITTGSSRDVDPRFSPDGKSIAFASDREGNFDIWLVRVDRPSTLEQITTTPLDEVHPTFSPDGKRIAYCRFSPRQGWNLWIRELDRQTLVELGPGLFPEWAPTGEWIAFQKPSEKGARWYRIWIIRPDGGDVRQVVAFDDRGAIQPTWSPEGDMIAFTTTARLDDDFLRLGTAVFSGIRRQGDEISVIELRHGRTFQLTRHGGASWSPSWSLTGRIFFTSDRYDGRDILSLVPPEVHES